MISFVGKQGVGGGIRIKLRPLCWINHFHIFRNMKKDFAFVRYIKNIFGTLGFLPALHTYNGGPSITQRWNRGFWVANNDINAINIILLD